MRSVPGFSIVSETRRRSWSTVKTQTVTTSPTYDGLGPALSYDLAPLEAAQRDFMTTLSTVVRTTDGRTLYFERSSLARPNDIYALTRGGAAQQLTHDNDPLLQPLALSTAQDYWYKGAEGANVQGLIIRPPNFDATKKYPALVLIHGGPQGNWSDSWGYRWNPQMFAARGYVVFMPNPRGSTGYGQKFVEDISGDWGGKAYNDIMNGVDQIARMPFVDGTRIGEPRSRRAGVVEVQACRLKRSPGTSSRKTRLRAHDTIIVTLRPCSPGGSDAMAAFGRLWGACGLSFSPARAVSARPP